MKLILEKLPGLNNLSTPTTRVAHHPLIHSIYIRMTFYRMLSFRLNLNNSFHCFTYYITAIHCQSALKLIRSFYEGAHTKLKRRRSAADANNFEDEAEAAEAACSSTYRLGLTRFISNICTFLDNKGFNLASARKSPKKLVSTIELIAFLTCQFINKGHDISDSSMISSPFLILPSAECRRELATNDSLFPIKLVSIRGIFKL